jgi:hypothetical protein
MYILGAVITHGPVRDELPVWRLRGAAASLIVISQSRTLSLGMHGYHLPRALLGDCELATDKGHGQPSQ